MARLGSYEPGNADDLAAKVKYIFSNREMALSMSKYASESFRNRYSAEKHYDRLMRIYNKAVDAKIKKVK